MGRFAKGCKRDHILKIANKLAGRTQPEIATALAADLPPSADLSGFSPPILDQNSTGSCTAHSVSGATYTALAAARRPLSFIPSPREIYAATRALERSSVTPVGAPLAALSDGGAQLADVAQAIGRYGVKPIAAPSPQGFNSDVDPSNVNDDPDLEGLELSGTFLVAGEYLIDSSASDVSDVVAAAIASGLPVWTAFFCDTAFEDLKPGQVAGVPNYGDSEGGGHAVYLSGYSGPKGTRVFTLTNSWGPDWCDKGRCLVSEAWLAATWSLYPMAVTVKGAP